MQPRWGRSWFRCVTQGRRSRANLGLNAATALRLEAAAKSQHSVFDFGRARSTIPCFHFAGRNVHFQDAKCLIKCEKY